jgi:hypothetical protein
MDPDTQDEVTRHGDTEPRDAHDDDAPKGEDDDPEKDRAAETDTVECCTEGPNENKDPSQDPKSTSDTQDDSSDQCENPVSGPSPPAHQCENYATPVKFLDQFADAGGGDTNIYGFFSSNTINMTDSDDETSSYIVRIPEEKQRRMSLKEKARRIHHALSSFSYNESSRSVEVLPSRYESPSPPPLCACCCDMSCFGYPSQKKGSMIMC